MSTQRIVNQPITVYLAGPDVFEPEPAKVGEQLKAIAAAYGFHPLFPFDNAVLPDDPDPSRTIYAANIAMIERADVVVANLNAFRGPEPDSGTVYEVGYALGRGKRVIGYIATDQSMVERVMAIEGRAMPNHPPYTDGAGKSIENFGHSVNLMLVHGVEQLVVGDLEAALGYLAKTLDVSCEPKCPTALV